MANPDPDLNSDSTKGYDSAGVDMFKVKLLFKTLERWS